MTSEVNYRSAAELLGVPAPAGNARVRLLTRAIDLFYRNGFNAVGLDRIIAEVGVTKTTFYKHFESKDDLMVQAVQLRDDWESQAWTQAVRKVGGDDPRAQLLAFFDVMDVWFNDPTFNGCMFINAAAEFPNPHDPVHQIAAKHKRATRDSYRDLARQAGATDPEAFADAYALLVEGTLIMRQTYNRNDAAKIARPTAEHMINQYIPARPATRKAAARGKGSKK